MTRLFFVPRAEREPLRQAGILDAVAVSAEAGRSLRCLYRELRTAGVRPEAARSALVRSVHIGMWAHRWP